MVGAVGSGVSSAQLWTLLTGAGAAGDSVSVGSLGTISNDSARGSSALDGCLSHCSSAAAFAAPVSMFDAGGALDASSSPPTLRAFTPFPISVSPALATVGSVASVIVAVSDSGGAGWACATSSTHASSAAKGASSRAACLI